MTVRICFTDQDVKDIISDYWMDDLAIILNRKHHFDGICKLLVERLNERVLVEDIFDKFRFAVGKASEDYAKLNYKAIEKI